MKYDGRLYTQTEVDELIAEAVKIEENTCPICGASPMTANCNGANCDE
jgi:formate dehydrogenase maturation protein FdhE